MTGDFAPASCPLHGRVEFSIFDAGPTVTVYVISTTVTAYVISTTSVASNLPIATSTPPVVSAKEKRRVLRLERRQGFRSYVCARGKLRAESAPPAIGDAPRKEGRWLAIARNSRRRAPPDLPEEKS